jgi:hypothetical protein
MTKSGYYFAKLIDGIEKGQNKTQDDFIKETLYKAAD